MAAVAVAWMPPSGGGSIRMMGAATKPEPAVVMVGAESAPPMMT